MLKDRFDINGTSLSSFVVVVVCLRKKLKCDLFLIGGLQKHQPLPTGFIGISIQRQQFEPLLRGTFQPDLMPDLVASNLAHGSGARTR